MTAKHTPGPWKADEHQVTGLHGAFVADCEDTASTSYVEDCANAALIAAAPDLLDALEALLVPAKQATEQGDPDVAKAVAAIAKARGGA